MIAELWPCPPDINFAGFSGDGRRTVAIDGAKPPTVAALRQIIHQQIVGIGYPEPESRLMEICVAEEAAELCRVPFAVAECDTVEVDVTWRRCTESVAQ